MNKHYRQSMVIHLVLFPLLLVLVLVFVCAAVFVLHLFLLFILVFFVRVPVIASLIKQQNISFAGFNTTLYIYGKKKTQTHFKQKLDVYL